MSLFSPILISSVQILARRACMIKPIKLMCEMQQALLEFTDHQIVAGAIRHASVDFIFEEPLPSFEISKVVWFCHGCLQYSQWRCLCGDAPSRVSPIPINRRAEIRDAIFDMNQTALLTFLRFDQDQRASQAEIEFFPLLLQQRTLKPADE